jgi:hypothetical protein
METVLVNIGLGFVCLLFFVAFVCLIIGLSKPRHSAPKKRRKHIYPSGYEPGEDSRIDETYEDYQEDEPPSKPNGPAYVFWRQTHGHGWRNGGL